MSIYVTSPTYRKLYDEREYYAARKYQEAHNCIRCWEQRYAGEAYILYTLILNAYLDSRSPGRKAAYKEWLEVHGYPIPKATH